MRNHIRRVVLATLGATLAFAAPALAAAPPSHGDLLQLNANQSTNWFGYNQGLLEKGTPLRSITGKTASLLATATSSSPGMAATSGAWNVLPA